MKSKKIFVESLICSFMQDLGELKGLGGHGTLLTETDEALKYKAW